MFRKTTPVFFGWHVVGAAFVIAVLAWGIGFYGPPIFLETLQRSRGWSPSLISAAITMQYLFGAAFIAGLAKLHRRFGIPAVTSAGGVLTALGLLGWAFARDPWQLFAITLLSGAGWAMTSGAAINAMVAPWFDRRRPAALSMAFNGASVGGVIFSPLWVALIAALSFRWAAVIVAGAVSLILWLLANRYLAPTPASLGLLPDGDSAASHGAAVRKGCNDAALLENPWRDRRFATLAIAASLALFAQVGLVAELFSLLVPAMGEAGASATMVIVTVSAVAGRTLLGIAMGPTADRRVVAAANVSLQVCGSLALLLAGGSSVPLLLFGCLLFGLGLGNVVSVPPLIAQTEFTPADTQRVVALTVVVSQATFAFAPAAFGLLRDAGQVLGLASHPGSAPLLFAAAASVQVASAVVVLLGRRAVRLPVASAVM
ncbi:MAG TPA: MFS transporter [Acetobacteraceae bacterium]|jgi:MFS family permease